MTCLKNAPLFSATCKNACLDVSPSEYFANSSVWKSASDFEDVFMKIEEESQYLL